MDQDRNEPPTQTSFAPPDKPETDLTRLEDLGTRAEELLQKSKAQNTRKAYKSDWVDFDVWCQHYRRCSLPALPETVAYYLADQSEFLKVSTLERRIATISEAHKAAGFDTPTRHSQVRLVWAGIRREKGVAQAHVKPVLTRHVRLMIEKLPEDLRGVRDRALILLGFAGAMRRSELVGLDVADLAIGDEGMVVQIRKSKTDQEGEGRKVGIPYGTNPETCPVRAVTQWVDLSGIDEGPAFRAVSTQGLVSDTRLTDRVVANVVKRSLRAAGKTAKRYAGHSLRAGLITQAAMNGVSERAIQDQSGHRSLTVMRRYIRDGSLFRDNAAGKVGL